MIPNSAYKVLIGALGRRVAVRGLMLTMAMLALASPPPPPSSSFTPTQGLNSPNVQAPQEPLIPGDPGTARNGSAHYALPGCSESLGAPEWWLNSAIIVWRILPILGGVLLFLCASCMMCRCLRGNRCGCGKAQQHQMPYPYPYPPYPSPFPPPTRHHSDAAPPRRRPTFMHSRFSSIWGRGLLWSHRQSGSLWGHQHRHPTRGPSPEEFSREPPPSGAHEWANARPTRGCVPGSVRV
jgi:hypothetical protein